jgi:biofilm PGA synthesis N-glycosyltransferase PgaC
MELLDQLEETNVFENEAAADGDIIPRPLTREELKRYNDKVVALVPAYNEEDIIERTIDSLMAQTYAFSYILVIANNCTDQTVEIVQRLQQFYGTDKLRLVVMAENKGKKAGALNFGFDMLEDDVDLVFCMDSDTIVHPEIIEMGVRKFNLRTERNTGGICSAYRALPFSPHTAVPITSMDRKARLVRSAQLNWKQLLWRLQNIEFGLANAWRVEHHKSARVLPGVAVMYRMEALRDIQRLHMQNDVKDKTVWATNCLVEDYLLTLELKDLNWGSKSSHDMISWSDVPLKLNGKGGLWDQRQRWYSGTVDVIRPRGLKKHSRYEAFTIALLVVNLLMRFLLVSSYAVLIASGVPIELLSVFLILPVIAVAMQLYRLINYADQLDKWQIIFTATLVVNELYAIYRESLYAYSVWLSYARPDRAW